VLGFILDTEYGMRCADLPMLASHSCLLFVSRANAADRRNKP